MIGESQLKQTNELRNEREKEFKISNCLKLQSASRERSYSRRELDLPLNALYHLRVPRARPIA